MPELVAAIPGTSLNERIDELSTSLIIDGVDALTAEDFHKLSEQAAAGGSDQMAMVARSVAKAIAPPGTLSIPELTRLLSSQLVEMRRLLDEPGEAPGATERQHANLSDGKEVAAPRAAKQSSLAGDEDLIREFIIESTEHLITIDVQILLLEKNSADAEILNAIFRGFHTIKGLAGFLEFAEIQQLAHEVETLLDLARTMKISVTPSLVDVVLESTDVVRQELAAIEQGLAGRARLATNVNEALLQRIQMAARGDSAPGPGPMGRAAETIAPVPAKQHDAASSIRIETSKLDQLMDMVGEMVIAQTLIGHSPALAGMKDTRLMRDLSQLARITADVQKLATGMRMVPVGIQFQKTARVIRDLSRRAGKQIMFETSGEDTELDKTIAEELSDPLLHMVRNSIDHGIETPEERKAAGKEATAHIRLAAYHQSGQIVVAISDDGRGLNRERILAKARQNGLIQAAAQLTDNEIFLLIFEAGFSTAEKVTDISGRGVGMDVVRRHVQKLRGRIDIESKQGEGTTFFIRLPLTLAIIEGLVVLVGAERYIVPISSVRQMFRPTAEALSTVQGAGEMVMVRDHLVPIVRLHRQFAVIPRTTQVVEGMLIVCESEGNSFCLLVDDLVGKQEVVIKSLGSSFKDIEGLAGCAILGDGRVGLILDIDGVYKGRG